MTKNQTWEAPANMETKCIELSRRITSLVVYRINGLSFESKQELAELLDKYENALDRYRKYEIPWDSQIIEGVEKVDNVRVKVKQISTFDSVMDHARNLFCFLSLTN